MVSKTIYMYIFTIHCMTILATANVLTPDLGPMNFTVMVEGFIMDVITIIMHSLIEKDILTFNTFSLYDPIGPAPKS